MFGSFYFLDLMSALDPLKAVEDTQVVALREIAAVELEAHVFHALVQRVVVSVVDHSSAVNAGHHAA